MVKYNTRAREKTNCDSAEARSESYHDRKSLFACSVAFRVFDAAKYHFALLCHLIDCRQRLHFDVQVEAQ